MTDITVLSFLEALLQTSMIIMVGLYFIFSNTVIPVLSKTSEGANVMVDINKKILNPIFLSCFVISGFAGLYFFVYHAGSQSLAGIVFFIGTTLVTVLFNVPLNNKLKDTPDERLPDVWKTYQTKWLMWNHVRSLAGVASGLLLSI